MAKYNIYKIKENQTEALKAHLTVERKYTLTDTFLSEKYQIFVYISEQDTTKIWWLEQYVNHFTGHTGKYNQIYSGAVIATDGNSSYVVPLGKTHFYIPAFIEYSFGLELAEKIADDNQTKMKGLKQHGGKTSKSLVSYNSGSSLLFSSGESAEYLKLKARDKVMWGDSFIHFGTSVQVNSTDKEPTNLGFLLRDIENALAAPSILRLPLMKEIKDESLVIGMYQTLADKILTLDQSVGILDYEIYGVDFIFSQQTHVKLKYDTTYSRELTQLTLQDILDFVNANSIDIKKSLPEIKIQFLVDGHSKYTISLVQFIEYCSDKIYLYRGKWFIFNDSFIDTLHEALSKINVSKFPVDFSEVEYQTWKAAQTKKIKYRERFIIEKLHSTLGYSILDREMDVISDSDHKKYKIEIGDLYDTAKKELYVIKIGEPSDFGYAFDQAFATLSNTENKIYTDAKGVSYPLDILNVLLIFQTKRTLTSATDTQSIIFEIKLNELQKLAQQKDVTLQLTFTTVL